MLTEVVMEKNKLQDSNTQLGEELKDVRAQLADSVNENKSRRGGIFSMWSNLPSNNSEAEGVDRVISAGMLTGRPEEEMSGFSSDLLQELSQVHEQARQAMRSVSKALWPSASPSGRWRSLYSYSRKRGGALDCGRYRPAGKVHERPERW